MNLSNWLQLFIWVYTFGILPCLWDIIFFPLSDYKLLYDILNEVLQNPNPIHSWLHSKLNDLVKFLVKLSFQPRLHLPRKHEDGPEPDQHLATMRAWDSLWQSKNQEFNSSEIFSGTMWDHVGPCGTMWDHTYSIWAIWIVQIQQGAMLEFLGILRISYELVTNWWQIGEGRICTKCSMCLKVIAFLWDPSASVGQTANR